MGSCISKCRSRTKSKTTTTTTTSQTDQCHLVQDKLVISQAPTPPIDIPTPTKAPLPLPSPPPSYSPCSLSCTTTTTTTTTFSSTSCSKSPSSSSSTCSSSNFTWKDKSSPYSNDFLWSCVKDNPHLISASSSVLPAVINKFHAPCEFKLNPRHVVGSSKHERARTTSPSPKRQRSFRKSEPADETQLRPTSPLHRRTTGNGGGNTCKKKGTTPNNKNRVKQQQVSNSEFGVRRNPRSVSPSNKENLRPVSPLNNKRHGGYACASMEKVETCTHHVDSSSGVTTTDQIQKGLSNHKDDFNSLPMDEGIDNPLISLDCFIFL